MIKKVIKRITHPFLKFWFKLYYSKPRTYTYENLEVIVLPEVFPPHFTISTKILLDYIKPLDLKDKSVLELGCGSGIISLFASSKGAQVTATDINEVALEELKVASKKYNFNMSIIYSDLFDTISQNNFDYIIINPPYYPKHPNSTKEKAWFCGENFEYFEKLFMQLSNRLNDQNVFMILSVDCELKSIQNIAKSNNLKLTSVFEKSVFGERNFIFEIIKHK